MVKKVSKNVSRKKRHLRQRQNIVGTPDRPRLNVFRSNSHIYAQIIDDENKVTLTQASTLDKELKLEQKCNKEAAKAIGELVAKRAQALKITKVVFDRGGYLYHGKIKELADAARSAGLEF